MPYKLTRNPNHTIKVDAHLEAEVVDQERSQITAAIRRKARVPGFRPGKAPLSAVRVRFAEEIREELEEHLTGMLWHEVLDGDDAIEPLTRPHFDEIDFAADGGFRFSAEMEVRPDYELPTLDGVELPEVSVDVNEAEVESELEKIRQQQATWEPAEEAQAEDGMMVEADLHGVIEGGDEPYDEQDARFVVGAEGVPDQINEALQGAKVGDERRAEKLFPEDDEDEKRAGKKVTYTIVVKSLKRQSLPPIDDDLATALGIDSLEELNERLHNALEHKRLGERRETWRRHILDHLEEGIDVNELPSSLVQSAVSEDVNRFAYTMAMQGMSPESGEIDWQELAAKFEPGARRKVLDTLVLEKLSEQWEIAVPENDVDAHLAMEAQRMGVPPAEHKANLAKEGKLEQLRHAGRISATVDELIRRVGGEVE